MNRHLNPGASSAAPLSMPRRFAIHLLHQAQLAGEQPFVGIVGASAEPDPQPDLFLPLEQANLAQGLARLDERQRSLWAIYLHRPGQPTAPTSEDFAEQPQALRLTASLATKGVLQLRAWVQDGGKVLERELHIAD
jgi:hypothetical protein